MFRPAFSALLVSLGLAAPAGLVAWHAYREPGSLPLSETMRAQFRPYSAVQVAAEPAAEKSIAAESTETTAPVGESESGSLSETVSSTPSADKATLSPEMVRLRDQVRQALAMYAERPVNARDHSPWETFHWILAYNVDAELYTHGPGGATANAVGWLCYNRACRGQHLLELKHGRPMGIYGVGLEGHTGQFLAILGQSRVMIDYPLLVKGRQFTLADLVENCQLSCTSGKDVELTFLLIGLSHYLHPNTVWKSREGETWSIPRLIREEISKPIHGAACGGTHRLMGLSYAVRKCQQHELPVTGEYQRAAAYVADYIKYALKLQNTDGSLSTEWFTGRGSRQDIDRRLQTTGHMLEWIVFASPAENLQDPQIVKAVDYVSRILIENRDHAWKLGHLGHGLRSLSLYNRHVFQPLERSAPEVAKREARSAPEQEKSEQNTPPPVTKPAPQDNQTLGDEGVPGKTPAAGFPPIKTNSSRRRTARDAAH